MDDQTQNNNNNGIEEVQSLGFDPQSNQPKQDVPQQPIPTPQPEPIAPIQNLGAELQPEMQTPSQDLNSISEPTPTTEVNGVIPEPIDQIQNINEEPIQDLSNTQTQENKSEKKPKSGKLIWILLGVVILAMIAIGIYAYSQTQLTKTPITTFEECLTSEGSMLQESYPPVCVTKDGLSFVADVPPVEEPIEPVIEKTLAEKCYEQASSAECAEGVVCMTNPASSFCECMGGNIEISELDDGSQYGVCLIDGNEYNEWEYYRLMSPVAQEPEEEAESPFGNIRDVDYVLAHAEGTCTIDSQCVWESQGCGGGHGICTNEPTKYEGVITTCEVNPNFPSNLGYTCGCVETVGRCGWKK